MNKSFSFLCAFICAFFSLQGVQAVGHPVNYLAKLERGTQDSEHPPEVIESKRGAKYAPDAVAVVVVTKVTHPDSVDVLVNASSDLPEEAVSHGYSADEAIALLKKMGCTLKSDPAYKYAPQKGRMINAPYVLVYKVRKDRDEPAYTVITHKTEEGIHPRKDTGQIIQVFFIAKQDIEGQPVEGIHAETLQRVKYKKGMEFLSLRKALQHSSLVHQIVHDLALDNPGLKG